MKAHIFLVDILVIYNLLIDLLILLYLCKMRPSLTPISLFLEVSKTKKAKTDVDKKQDLSVSFTPD